MRSKWLLQTQGFSFSLSDEHIESFQRLGFDYDTFGVISKTNTLLNLERLLSDEPVCYIIRGGTRILDVLAQSEDITTFSDQLTAAQIAQGSEHLKRLKAGMFYDVEKFDQAFYSRLDLPLINRNARFYSVKESLDLTFKEHVFVKPSRDLKAFNAGVLEAGVSVGDYIKHQAHQAFAMDETLVVAPLKTIYSEYRFFIVNQEVITCSTYRLGGKVFISSDVPDDLIKSAQQLCKLYQPHDVFTMDLAQTSEGIEIIEYNCWNASGAYACDLQKIFYVVNEYQLARSAG